jgi:hypothetical protein
MLGQTLKPDIYFRPKYTPFKNRLLEGSYYTKSLIIKIYYYYYGSPSSKAITNLIYIAKIFRESFLAGRVEMLDDLSYSRFSKAY